MRKPVLKSTLALMLLGGLMTSCGPALKVDQKPLATDVSTMPEKKGSLDKDQLKSWPAMDMHQDTVPGMSVKRAYDKIIKDNEGKTVVVAVLDAGVDINHEDLKNVIWTNEKEIPGNGKDDDNNGYVDDVHGWNFLGDQVHDNLEYTRFVKKWKSKYSGKTADEISPENKDEYDEYKRAKKKYDEEIAEARQNKMRYEQIKNQFEKSIGTVKNVMGGLDFTREDLSEKSSNQSGFGQSKAMVLQIMQRGQLDNGQGLQEALDQIKEGADYFSSKVDYHLNLDFDGRSKVGDDVDDLSDTDYGNNDVTGPTEDKEDILHGTHVAGIIAAERNNDIGMNGVANNVKIMPIRAVPDGDERDKDIALGIRYAVDNGAKIINMSFGKYFSAHPDWVVDAIKYAAKHDVLLVNASGNESKDLDETRGYPNDQWPGHEEEIADNMISIGALNFSYGEDMVAPFSNYGKTNVDIFSPGMQIWSTAPLDKYKFLQGTSMAAPEVAGIAAVIRSYFPKLSAAQVKKVIMDSGLTTDKEVVLGGDADNKKPFNEASKSGNMANLYNALIMASKM